MDAKKMNKIGIFLMLLGFSVFFFMWSNKFDRMTEEEVRLDIEKHSNIGPRYGGFQTDLYHSFGKNGLVNFWNICGGMCLVIACFKGYDLLKEHYKGRKDK